MESSRSRKVLVAVLVLFFLAALFLLVRRFRAGTPEAVAAVDYSEIRATDSLSSGARALLSDTMPGTLPAASAPPAPTGPVVRVRLPQTLAPTAGPAGHQLRVALELSIAGGRAAEAEVREREEGLLRLVRFVLSRKVPAQIRSDSCRPELLARFNAFLSAGRAVDLRFLTLEPVAPGGAP